jgi:ribosome maturation factor RimP
MVHPLIPQVEALAKPVAQDLGFEVVQVNYFTNQFPPVLRVSIRPQDSSLDTSHAHCERMSLALEPHLDAAELVTNHYVLEVSSPGLGRHLQSDRDFEVFRGFPVSIQLHPPLKGKTQIVGTLLSRDPEKVVVSQRGRRVELPRSSIQEVLLQDQKES